MNFQDYQRAFAAHIRDPRAAARPKGVPADRMRVYNQLLYNNVEGFLLACFPVCRQVLGQRRWTRMVRAFFRDHACTSPYFRQISEEFLAWLESAWPRLSGYPAFLPELAHHEWVELALETSDLDAELPAYDPNGDLLAGHPLINPVLQLNAYVYPVQRIGPRQRPKGPGTTPTFLLAFRNQGLQVRFMEINALTARLLDLLRASPEATGETILTRLASELEQNPEALKGPGRAIMETLRDQGVLLGATL